MSDPAAIHITRIRIARWAKACRGRVLNGWPSSSAFTHANEGDRAYDLVRDLPPDLAEVDRARAALAEKAARAWGAANHQASPEA